MAVSGEISQLATALKNVPEMTFAEIKNLRTQIGEGLKGQGVFKDIGQQDLNQLYGALKDDMIAAAKSVSPQAQNALQTASDFTAQYRRQFEDIGKVLGAKGPEDISRILWNAAQGGIGKGDIGLLMKVRRSMSQEAWNDVASGLLREMSLGVPSASTTGERMFSTSSLMSNFTGMADDAKNLFFGLKGTPWRDNLEHVIKVFGPQTRLAKLANTSNTANQLAGGAWALGGILNPKNWAKELGGGVLISKAFSSPAFLDWLAGTVNAKTPAQVGAQVARFNKLYQTMGLTVGEANQFIQSWMPYYLTGEGSGTPPPPRSSVTQQQPAFQ